MAYRAIPEKNPAGRHRNAGMGAGFVWRNRVWFRAVPDSGLPVHREPLCFVRFQQCGDGIGLGVNVIMPGLGDQAKGAAFDVGCDQIRHGFLC